MPAIQRLKKRYYKNLMARMAGAEGFVVVTLSKMWREIDEAAGTTLSNKPELSKVGESAVLGVEVSKPPSYPPIVPPVESPANPNDP